jgi:hypothetical protein
MFEILLFLGGAIAIAGLIIAFDGSRDVFHPLVFICPLMLFIYFWMPWKLLSSGGLAQFFDNEQLVFVQKLNVLGISAFIGACLCVGLRVKQKRLESTPQLSLKACQRILIGAA